MPARRLTALGSTFALIAALLVALPSSAQAAPLPGPAGLQVTTSGGDIQLTWAGVQGAAAYTAQVSADPTFASTLDSIATYGRSFVPRTTLGGDTDTLYWRVAAHESGTSEASRGAWSSTTSQRPILQSPALTSPANGATVNYPTPVRFTWQPVPGAISYELQYSSDETFPATSATTTVTATGTSYAPATPLARVTWHWRVRAKYFSGTSSAVLGPLSNSRSVTVDWPAAASRPTLLSPAHYTEGQPAISDLLFEWSPVAGARYYTITIGRAQDGIEVTQLETSAEVTGTSFVPEISLLDGTYFWQVVAHDQAGLKGTASEIRQIKKTWGAQSAPAHPSGDTWVRPIPQQGSTDVAEPELINFNQFELSWTAIPRATYYEVQVIPQNGGDVLTCRTASTSATIIAQYVAGAGSSELLHGVNQTCLWNNAVEKRIRPGVLYRWQVRGVDAPASWSNQNFQSGTPDPYIFSQWSSPTAADNRYFMVVDDDRPHTVAPPVQDTVSWETQSNKHRTPAPVMEWAPVENAVGYEVRIYRGDTTANHIYSLRTPQTKLRPHGVLADSSTLENYTWRVVAISTGEGSADQWHTRPVYLEPTQPDSFLGWPRLATTTTFPASPAVDVNGGTLLRWSPQFASAPGDGGSRGYQIEIFNSSNVRVGVPKKVEYPFWLAATPSSGTSSNPLPNGEYRFRVAPLDANGAPGPAVFAPGTFTVAPTAPQGLVATVAGSQTRFTWNASPGAEGYRVTYWNTATPGTRVTLPSTSGTVGQTTTEANSLKPGTYQVHVQSRGKGGHVSNAGTVVTFVVPVTAPGLVTPDNAVLSSAQRVLEWEPVAGASRYLVQMATSSGALASAKAVETSATSFAVPDNVRFGTTYYWRVSAVTEKWSSSATLTARDVLGTSVERRVNFVTTPAQVRLNSPKAENRTVTLTWPLLTGADAGAASGVAYVARYRLKTTPERVWTTLPPTSAGAVGITFTVPTAGGTYEFQVAARNTEGQGEWSATKSLLVKELPTKPLSAKATAGKARVDLRWSSPASDGGSPVTDYLIESRRYDARTKTWSRWSRIAKVEAGIASTFSYRHAKLAAGTKYQYRIAAETAFGTGPFASIGSVTPLGKPAAPKSVKVKAKKGKSVVKWKAAPSNGSKITGYTVQYSTNGKKWKKVKKVKAGVRKVTTKVGKKGTKVYFRVIAKNKIGKGTPSTVVVITKK